VTESEALLQLGEPVLVDVDLLPRIELGPDNGPALSRRLTIGQPVIFAVPPTVVHDGTPLGEYLRAEARTSSYFILDLVVSVRPEEGESFVSVGVGVQLAGAGSSREQPIAWSLAPLRSATPVTLRRTVGLTVKAVLVEPKVEQQIEESREDYFVVAFGKRESAFEWRYTASTQRALIGTHGMQAVIKAPAGTEVRADIVVAATMTLPRSGFRTRSYRADLPPRLKTVYASPNPLLGTATPAIEPLNHLDRP
jgi:hypothetical protein